MGEVRLNMAYIRALTPSACMASTPTPLDSRIAVGVWVVCIILSSTFCSVPFPQRHPAGSQIFPFIVGGLTWVSGGGDHEQQCRQAAVTTRAWCRRLTSSAKSPSQRLTPCPPIRCHFQAVQPVVPSPVAHAHFPTKTRAFPRVFTSQVTCRGWGRGGSTRPVIFENFLTRPEILRVPPDPTRSNLTREILETS